MDHEMDGKRLGESVRQTMEWVASAIVGAIAVRISFSDTGIVAVFLAIVIAVVFGTAINYQLKTVDFTGEDE